MGDAAEPAYEVLDELAARAQRAYAELVHETPGFVEYFKASTPVSEIGALNIGSRPTSRKPTDVDLGSAGHPVGAGLEPVAGDAARLVRHRDGVRGWIAEAGRAAGGTAGPVPAVAVLPHGAVEHGAGAGQDRDMGLAARYAELVEDEALRRRVFDKIVDEHERTIAMHKLITGQDDLLADNPALARSVFNRFPYLEPLNHLQVELLRRYRSGDDDELVQRRHPADDERAGDARCATAGNNRPTTAPRRWQRSGWQSLPPSRRGQRCTC